MPDQFSESNSYKTSVPALTEAWTLSGTSFRLYTRLTACCGYLTYSSYISFTSLAYGYLYLFVDEQIKLGKLEINCRKTNNCLCF